MQAPPSGTIEQRTNRGRRQGDTGRGNGGASVCRGPLARPSLLKTWAISGVERGRMASADGLLLVHLNLNFAFWCEMQVEGCSFLALFSSRGHGSRLSSRTHSSRTHSSRITRSSPRVHVRYSSQLPTPSSQLAARSSQLATRARPEAVHKHCPVSLFIFMFRPVFFADFAVCEVFTVFAVFLARPDPAQAPAQAPRPSSCLFFLSIASASV